MKYCQFLATFPPVRRLTTMQRITLYRLFRDGRMVAVCDRATGTLRFVPARLKVADVI